MKAELGADGRFVIEEFDTLPPFSSFLPGIAGPLGIPLWAFYVNRGQAIASFGAESKDGAIVEFQPANKAYQLTPFTGFRTFIKLAGSLYEPFGAARRENGAAAVSRTMRIGMNELELEERGGALDVRVVYFILPGASLGALVRQLTITNRSRESVKGELIDGLPAIVPFGVANSMLKEMGRTAEAWMDVFNRDNRIPFYRVRASLEDKPQVKSVSAGHFYFAFAEDGALLPPICDPALVFGQNTALTYPDAFATQTLDGLLTCDQHTEGKTPCGMFGVPFALASGESLALHALIGHAGDVAVVNRLAPRLADARWLADKRREANDLVRALTDPIETQTASPLFDAYCRQTLLDNILRGGWPVLIGPQERRTVCHLYARKHGDLERDYNAFFLPAEYYSQGNGNYRDVNQNRRDEVLFNPAVGLRDIRTFVNLLQTDGYNPLVLLGSRFTLRPESCESILSLLDQPVDLSGFFDRPFTPGGLLTHIVDRDIQLKVPPEEFLDLVIAASEQEFSAEHGEGYWIDHWTYDLDLIEKYLAVFPEQRLSILFDDRSYTYYDSAAVVRPRVERYVLDGDTPRQLNAVRIDADKLTLIASRVRNARQARTEHGQGQVYTTTLIAKLVGLAACKFATMDPAGMGIEMEAGKPGWYDALNGLPALFGSSMCETYELARLFDFMLKAIRERGDTNFSLPIEVAKLIATLSENLQTYRDSRSPDREFEYWERAADAREEYRAHTRLGFDGREVEIALSELGEILAAFREKVHAGIDRALALGGGLPPTYLSYTVAAYEPVTDEQGQRIPDARGRPRIHPTTWQAHLLPPFLEGAVHWLKLARDPAAARELYRRVRASPLYDGKLEMYKVNGPLGEEPPEIGRARAFTPGWLENESIWLHMEYKYLLEILRAGLHDEFFSELKALLVPFMDPGIYGRSILESSSFIVSSAHPDPALHGRGFVARLSGSTAEFLSIWNEMMAGREPFQIIDGEIALVLRPVLPGWLFDESGEASFRFLGVCRITYHNPKQDSLCGESGPLPTRIVIQDAHGDQIEMLGSRIPAPHSLRVRNREIETIDLYFA